MASSTPTLVRTSERGSFKKCEWAWDIEFNKRLRPVGPSAPPLRFGSLVHGSLEAFYKPGLKRGPRPHRTFRKLYDAEIRHVWDKFQVKVDDEWADAGTLGEAMLKNYWELYGKDDEYEIIATEHPFQVPVINEKTGKILFYYVGTLDGVWKHRPTRKILVCDHKTAKSIEQLIASLPKEDQAGAYWTFGVDSLYRDGILPKRMKLDGMLYNILAKRFKDERPQNKLGQHLNQPSKDNLLDYFVKHKIEFPSKTTMAVLTEVLEDRGVDVTQLGEVSKVQPPALFERHKEWRTEGNRLRQRQRVRDEFSRMRKIRRGIAPPLKAPSFSHCGGCPYDPVCQLDEAGVDIDPMLKSAYAKWDPYDAHVIADAR